MFVPFEIPYMLTRLTHCVKFEGLNPAAAGTGKEKIAKNWMFCHGAQWPMGGKINSRCQLGMLKVSKLRHCHLNVMRLKNYDPTGECLNNNH